jgi:hypothetical protein
MLTPRPPKPLCSEKMAAPGEQLCVLEYHMSKSMVMVQCAKGNLTS